MPGKVERGQEYHTKVLDGCGKGAVVKGFTTGPFCPRERLEKSYLKGRVWIEDNPGK